MLFICLNESSVSICNIYPCVVVYQVQDGARL